MTAMARRGLVDDGHARDEREVGAGHHVLAGGVGSVVLGGHVALEDGEVGVFLDAVDVGEVPDDGDALAVPRLLLGGLNARAPHLERVELADRAVGQLDGRVVDGAERIEQLGACVPGVEGGHA